MPNSVYYHKHILYEKMICEYRNFGCNATIGTSFEEFEDIDLHEQRCLFRPIECFHHKCQNQKFKLALFSILDHFRSTHHGRALEKIHCKKFNKRK